MNEWIFIGQHVNRMSRDRLPRIMKHYSPTGRRNRGRPLKRLIDTWDRKGSTSGLTPWQTHDDDDDDEYSFTILIIKANKIHYFLTLFWWINLHVSDRFTVHHHESRYCVYSEVEIKHRWQTVNISSMTNSNCCEYSTKTTDDGQ